MNPELALLLHKRRNLIQHIDWLATRLVTDGTMFKWKRDVFVAGAVSASDELDRINARINELTEPWNIS